jgi:hypothetical protein
MVRGLQLFREHFAAFGDQYALIGGTATMLALDAAGLETRATKDLDMVLCIEALDARFVQAFWRFIDLGGYEIRERSTGKKCFYRFTKPADERFPAMIELFSRVPDNVVLAPPATLTPIPVDEDTDSLSAILLDDDYYALVHSGTREFEGIRCVQPSHLIPMKARAWLDLSKRRHAGQAVDARDIRKHRNDIIRLFQLLIPVETVALPEALKKDLGEFLDSLANDPAFDTASVAKGSDKKSVVEGLRRIYGL